MRPGSISTTPDPEALHLEAQRVDNASTEYFVA